MPHHASSELELGLAHAQVTVAVREPALALGRQIEVLVPVVTRRDHAAVSAAPSA